MKRTLFLFGLIIPLMGMSQIEGEYTSWHPEYVFSSSTRFILLDEQRFEFYATSSLSESHSSGIWALHKGELVLTSDYQKSKRPISVIEKTIDRNDSIEFVVSGENWDAYLCPDIKVIINNHDTLRSVAPLYSRGNQFKMINSTELKSIQIAYDGMGGKEDPLITKVYKVKDPRANVFEIQILIDEQYHIFNKEQFQLQGDTIISTRQNSADGLFKYYYLKEK